MSKIPEELIQKYLNHTCTPEERSILESWYNAMAATEQSEQTNLDYQELEKTIWKELHKKNKPVKKINWSLMGAAAACLLICFLVYQTRIPTVVEEPAKPILSKILPGGNKAELILEDGAVIPLVDGTVGLLATENGVAITQHGSGRLVYHGSHSESVTEVKFNTLRTPKGGQYQIDLPDGTRAWLNAASSLKFPTTFNGSERRVELMGEVYFEVAVNKHQPFKVVSQDQTIEVLGTHFNVNSYPNEMVTTTTLFEGSVKVSASTRTAVIQPGEESVFNRNTQQIKIQKANLEEVKAWRMGYFQFQNEAISSIMRKLSRWYNMEVFYTKDFVDQRFNGSVSRFEDAEKVLKMLEYTGTVHFKREGRRITVMP